MAPTREQIRKVIETYRERLMRDPTAREIAERLGANPRDDSFRGKLKRVGKKLDWREPEKTTVQKKREELHKIVQAAMAIRYEDITNAYHPLPAEVSEFKSRAEEYVEENRDLLDKLHSLATGDDSVMSAPGELKEFLASQEFRKHMEDLTSWEELREAAKEYRERKKD